MARQVEHHTTARHTYSGGDLEQPQADRVDAPASLSGPLESQTTKAIDQDVGEGRHQQSELIGHELGATGPIGEQAKLLLLDPILHLTPHAVHRLIKLPRIVCHRAHCAKLFYAMNLFAIDARTMVCRVDDAFIARQIGDDEARIGAFAAVLGLADPCSSNGSASAPTTSSAAISNQSIASPK
jgi:hypothetical protein